MIAAVGEMESAGLIDLREIPQDNQPAESASDQQTEICITFRYGKTCFKTTQVSDRDEIVQPAQSSEKIGPVRKVPLAEHAPEPVAEPPRSAPQVIAAIDPAPDPPPDDPDDLGPELPDFGPQPSETDPV